jgi:hypothetical protein
MHDLRLLQNGLLAMVAGVAISITPAGATGYASMLNGTGLTPEDVELAQTAAQSLYTQTGVTAGAAQEWSNDQTGASGRVEVLQAGGSPVCVVYRHTTKAANAQATRLDYRRCKTADGTWELTP